MISQNKEKQLLCAAQEWLMAGYLDLAKNPPKKYLNGNSI